MVRVTSFAALGGRPGAIARAGRIGGALVLVSCAATVPTGAQAPPDFWTPTAPLALTIEADFRTLRTSDRQDGAPLRPAVIVLDQTGERVPALVRTRGNYRLRRSTCAFPPLRVQVATDSIPADAVPPELRGLGNARLVSPCQGTNADLVWLELLAYRLYTTITGGGYAARPVYATFVDSSGRDGPRKTDTFFVESDGHAARRLGIDPLPDTLTALIDPRILEPEAETVLSVFEYLIGNTDWGVEARHNVLVGYDAGRRLVAVPYDFDFAGLVDAPYAAPDPRFRRESVRDRIYRGVCRSDEHFSRVLADFLAKRDAVMAELEALDRVSGRRKGQARRYLEDFFREAENGRALRAFRATCR